MIRRRLHITGLIVVCAVLLVVGIIAAQGLPIGLGIIAVGMYGFVLGGFANLYLERIRR